MLGVSYNPPPSIRVSGTNEPEVKECGCGCGAMVKVNPYAMNKRAPVYAGAEHKAKRKRDKYQRVKLAWA